MCHIDHLLRMDFSGKRDKRIRAASVVIMSGWILNCVTAVTALATSGLISFEMFGLWFSREMACRDKEQTWEMRNVYIRN